MASMLMAIFFLRGFPFFSVTSPIFTLLLSQVSQFYQMSSFQTTGMVQDINLNNPPGWLNDRNFS